MTVPQCVRRFSSTAVALVVTLAGCGTSSRQARDATADVGAAIDGGGPIATVAIDVSHPGSPVSETFLGLSCEWSAVAKYLGDGAGHANPIVVRLLSAFAAEGNHPTVRVGGNSADEAWWNPSGTTPRPVNVTVDIGTSQVATLADLNATAGTTFIPDLNLALQGTFAGAAANAAALVQAIRTAVPAGAIRAFEVGNEPDLWFKNGLRTSSYAFPGWKTDYDAFTAALDAIVSLPPAFAAPALSGKSWLADLDAVYPGEQGNLSLVTAHRYPFNVCNGKSAPAVADLLADAAGQQTAAQFQAHVEAAHQGGLPFRVAETNSVACAGADGVSNVYAAALWGADVAFQLASIGADGVNFHTPGTFYAVFTVSNGSFSVQPLYYGMRFFSLAVPAGAALGVATATPSDSNLHVWATFGTDGKTRVALLNLDMTAGRTVSLQVGAASAATLVRMHGPAVDAKTGITLGGQTWDGSPDGAPQGTAATETITIDHGAARVTLPPLDAVVVTLN